MDVTAASRSAAPSAQSTSPAGMISSDFQTFLVMLTTQLQNQDPLNPIDSSDYAVQLATFSGVEQQVRTNSLLANLSTQMGLMGMAQLAGWVGMEARSAAPAHYDGAPVAMTPQPAAGADRAVLVTTDAGGREVTRDTLAPDGAPVAWAGVDAEGAPLPAGLYSFRLESYRGEELLATTPVEVYAPIVEARARDGQTVLLLAGGVEVTSAQVTALRRPGAALP